MKPDKHQSEHEQLVERLKARGRPVLPDIDPGDQDCWEAAEAIERLEAHNRELADWRQATATRADKLESDIFDNWLRTEKAERELAEEREERRRVVEADDFRYRNLEGQLVEARAEITQLQGVLRNTKGLLEKAYQDAYVITAKTGIFMALTATEREANGHIICGECGHDTPVHFPIDFRENIFCEHCGKQFIAAGPGGERQ